MDGEGVLQRNHLSDIRAGAETLLLSGQNDRADIMIGRHFVDRMF